MRQLLIKISGAFLFALLFTSANASWSGSGDLTIDYIYGSANITVYFKETVPNPAECSQAALKVVSWEGTDPAAQNFMSMMLAAKMGGRAVQIAVDGDTCLWGGWPKLKVMKLM